jgi:trk system potassium uptake protein
MSLYKFRFKESVYKYWFLFNDVLIAFLKNINPVGSFIFSLFSLLLALFLIIDLGFTNSNSQEILILKSYVYILTGLFVGKLLVNTKRLKYKSKFYIIINGVIIAAVLFALLLNHGWLVSKHHQYLLTKPSLVFLSLVIILSETHRLSGALSRLNLNPSLLFAYSFIIVILAGTGLLMLPKATFQPISFHQALFTSTSAVCVTGLVVVDTALVFTPMGKTIIIMLIQIGGLGIMSFTSFFSYIFSGSFSVKDRLILKDLFSEEQLGSMFRVLAKIIIFTLVIEAFGAFLLYHSLDTFWQQKTAIAIFHSVSAFCNAGFSVIPDGMANQMINGNYSFQMIIAVLIILGGIGFPVLLYFFNIINKKSRNTLYTYTRHKKEKKVFPFVIGHHLAIKTSVVLLILGSILYYWFERHNTLSSPNTWGNWIVAFFGSVSARTAGFNVLDITRWTYPTVFIMIILMWIGASPGSTGGGVKTTTLALAFRASVSYMRGKEHFEIGNREIGRSTLQRVLTIIFTSIGLIMTAFLALMVLEPDKNPVYLLFECVSAISTVGLSLVNSSTLSNNSQTIIILLMFVGRMGPVLLLSGIFYSKKKQFYRLPVEEIAIN